MIVFNTQNLFINLILESSILDKLVLIDDHNLRIEGERLPVISIGLKKSDSIISQDYKCSRDTLIISIYRSTEGECSKIIKSISNALELIIKSPKYKQLRSAHVINTQLKRSTIKEIWKCSAEIEFLIADIKQH